MCHCILLFPAKLGDSVCISEIVQAISVVRQFGGCSGLIWRPECRNWLHFYRIPCRLSKIGREKGVYNIHRYSAWVKTNWKNIVWLKTGSSLTLARKPCFATFAGVGGGVGATPPPWRFQTKRRRASRKRPADCSRRVLAIGGTIFGPRSIFDPVMAGQRSNFRKFHDFSTSRVDGIKTIYRSGMKPSPACSPFNSA